MDRVRGQNADTESSAGGEVYVASGCHARLASRRMCLHVRARLCLCPRAAGAERQAARRRRPPPPRPTTTSRRSGRRRRSRKLVFDTSVTPRWLETSDRFWYAYQTREGRRFYLVDPLKKTKVPLFDHAKMAAALTLDHAHPLRRAASAVHAPCASSRRTPPSSSTSRCRATPSSPTAAEEDDDRPSRAAAKGGDQDDRWTTSSDRLQQAMQPQQRRAARRGAARRRADAAAQQARSTSSTTWPPAR